MCLRTGHADPFGVTDQKGNCKGRHRFPSKMATRRWQTEDGKRRWQTESDKPKGRTRMIAKAISGGALVRVLKSLLHKGPSNPWVAR
jgi:hypothetical protein